MLCYVMLCYVLNVADELSWLDGRLTRSWYSLPDFTVNYSRPFTARVQGELDR